MKERTREELAKAAEGIIARRGSRPQPGCVWMPLEVFLERYADDGCAMCGTRVLLEMQCEINDLKALRAALPDMLEEFEDLVEDNNVRRQREGWSEFQLHDYPAMYSVRKLTEGP